MIATLLDRLIKLSEPFRTSTLDALTLNLVENDFRARHNGNLPRSDAGEAANLGRAALLARICCELGLVQPYTAPDQPARDLVRTDHARVRALQVAVAAWPPPPQEARRQAPRAAQLLAALDLLRQSVQELADDEQAWHAIAEKALEAREQDRERCERARALLRKICKPDEDGDFCAHAFLTADELDAALADDPPAAPLQPRPSSEKDASP